MAFSKNKTILLFFIIFFHNSLLDLFFINHTGIVFLWQKNSQLNTILTHLLITFLVVTFFLLFEKLSNSYRNRTFKVGEKTWAICSVVLILVIGFLLL